MRRLWEWLSSILSTGNTMGRPRTQRRVDWQCISLQKWVWLISFHFLHGKRPRSDFGAPCSSSTSSRTKRGCLVRSKYICLRLDAEYKYFGEGRLLKRFDNPRDLIFGKRLILFKSKVTCRCSSLMRGH